MEINLCVDPIRMHILMDGELARCGFTVSFIKLKLGGIHVLYCIVLSVLPLRVQLSKASPTALFELLSLKHWKTGPLPDERACSYTNMQSDAAEKKDHVCSA